MKLPRLFSLETEYARGLLEAEYKYSQGLLEDIKHNAGGLTSNWTELRKAALKGRTAAAKNAKKHDAPAVTETRSQGKNHAKTKKGEKA